MRIQSPTITSIQSLKGDGAQLTGSFSGSFSTWEGISGKPDPILSSSAQIADDISGSLSNTAIAALNASIVSGSSQLASDISGSFVNASASIATDIDALQADSGSFSTRITTAEAELGNTLLSSSAQIASDISGSFVQASSSIASDIDTIQANISSNDSDISGLNSYTSSLKTAITVSGADTTILGNLTVQGTKTELQVATLNVEDLNITLASGSATAVAANGAGLTVAGAGATLTYASTGDKWVFNKVVDVPTSGLLINSTAVTATAAELNILDGADTDLNTLSVPANTTISTFGASLVDDADAATARTTIGLGNVENTALSTYTGNGGALDNQYITNGAGYITSAGSITGNAATATKLQTARTIAGVSFDGSANISLNNNAITNGAGYTTYSANQTLNNNSNVHFEGLMVGQTTGATANTIRCIGDIVAYYSSDAQFKDNVETLEGALDKVKAIRGVRFDWNDKQDVFEGHDIGVIAQEVEAVLPELVHYREHSDSKAVDYVKLTAVLIEAVKELSAKVDELSK